MCLLLVRKCLCKKQINFFFVVSLAVQAANFVSAQSVTIRVMINRVRWTSNVESDPNAFVREMTVWRKGWGSKRKIGKKQLTRAWVQPSGGSELDQSTRFAEYKNKNMPDLLSSSLSFSLFYSTRKKKRPLDRFPCFDLCFDRVEAKKNRPTLHSRPIWMLLCQSKTMPA